MAAMQVAPQQAQLPIDTSSYAQDPTPPSRRQYQQQSPQIGSRSQSNGRSPNTARRSSRQENIETASQPVYRSPGGASSSVTSTPRASEASHVSPSAPATQYQGRQDGRTQVSQSGGSSIVPPPRTSSNQRDPRAASVRNASLVDRTVSPRHKPTRADEQSPSLRDVPDLSSPDTSLHGGDREMTNGTSSPAGAATIPTAGASRRKGATSSDGPQRATSTREARAPHSSAGVSNTRSASHVIASSSPNPSDAFASPEAQVLNRKVVDVDPAVDLQREEERRLEAVPGLASSDPVEVNEAPKSTPRSRQEFSGSAAGSGRRKESKFGSYFLGQTLGEGEFGKVKLGWKKDGSVQVAIKLIRRESLGTNPSRLPKIHREISILETLQHPNIVKLHEMVETRDFIGIILEYASGGELFDYILNHRYLKDHMARKLFAQLVSGVGYLHKKGIVHRDLKLENLLLDRNRNIIITDFGFANTFNPADELGSDIEHGLTDRNFVKRMDLDRQVNGFRRGDLMATSCGSPCYAAPELVVTDSLYTGRKVDVWSCGVILYAMLAGYLPFDDDPANPEGDNINLLYKYITTTPLTFPEYVTPHARDLLRRILVPDPRKRADLFEVARHSWLSEYAHVVAQVTSNATTVGEIANTTATTSAQEEAPSLVRSASVREPARGTPATSPAVGGLSHQGKFDAGQPSDKAKAPRNPNRRTVQVEYVAPQSQTVRGESVSTVGSPAAETYVAPSSTGQASKSRARAEDGPEGSSKRYDSMKQQDARYSHSPYTQTGKSSRAQTRPGSSQRDMAPPARPPKDLPRSVSESPAAFGQLPSSTSGRPSTGGSMTPAGHSRLPSRGNSYSQPLAPTVATTNAQGRVTQPKGNKQYNISAPIPQPQAYNEADSIGHPDTQPYAPPPPPTLGNRKDAPRGHKRSNTLGNFFRTGSISGPRSGIQTPIETPPREKRYPPTSMKTPMPTDTPPRQSTDSRRPSFSFGRKVSDKNGDILKQEKSRRFSLLPASFSLRSFASASTSRDQASDWRPASERRGSSNIHTAPASRHQSRPQTMAYSQAPPPENEGMETDDRRGHDYDGSRDRVRSNGGYPVRDDRASRAQPIQYSSPPGQGRGDLPPLPHDADAVGAPYSGTPTESDVSLQQPRRRQQNGLQQHRPVYPSGFGDDSYEEEPRPSMQQERRGERLQKTNRKFADAYDQDAELGGGHHAGTSGAAKRVMDFFRRRGKARAGDDR